MSGSEARKLAKELRDIAMVGIVNARRDTGALCAAANVLEQLDDRVDELDRALEDAQERLAIMAEGGGAQYTEEEKDFEPGRWEYREEMRY